MIRLLDLLFKLLFHLLALLIHRGSVASWLKHLATCVLLGGGTTACLWITVLGFSQGRPLLGIVGLAGSIGLICLDWKYSTWWIKEGRYT